jgi:hypothetical protein
MIGFRLEFYMAAHIMQQMQHYIATGIWCARAAVTPEWTD